jgi:hypothetical protein
MPKSTSVSLRRYSPLDMGCSMLPALRPLLVLLRATYQRMRRLATAQANPRILRFFRLLMMRPRVRGLRSAQRAMFTLFTTVVSSPV